MRKGMPIREVEQPEEDSLSSAATIAALLLLAEKCPHRQFNSTELSIISGIGRTAMSQIKNAPDTPFSLGKCTMQRLDAWLASHPGWKQRRNSDKPRELDRLERAGGKRGRFRSA